MLTEYDGQELTWDICFGLKHIPALKDPHSFSADSRASTSASLCFAFMPVLVPSNQARRLVSKQFVNVRHDC